MRTSPSSRPRAPQALTHAERSELTDRLAWNAHHATTADERQYVEREIVRLNIRVARAIASRYRGRGIALDDLEQVACEGLVKAVQRFDPALHHDLLSYAVPTIRGELLRHFRDLHWAVRPPRRLQELERRVAAAVVELGSELARQPSSEEICTHLALDRSDRGEVVAALRGFRPLSLDRPVGDDGAATVGDVVADPVDRLSIAEDRALLAPALRRLSARDRRVLHLRFVEDRSQREIGDEMGVSQMQVSRWLARILAELRGRLTAGVRRREPLAVSR